jgi:hypothetical protein
MEKQPSKKQKTEDETEQEEPKTILKTETGNIDLTTILSLAFGGGITD